MNSLQIEYFVTLAACHNYSETARILFVSQPTVSKQIAALEDELGFKLFCRDNNSVCLTLEGSIMLEFFEKAKQQYSYYINRINSINEERASKLRVAFLEGVDIGHLVNEYFMILQQEKPNIEIEFEFMKHTDLNLELKNNEIDIAFTLADEVKGDNDLEFIDIAMLQHGIVVNKNNKYAQKDKLSPNLISKSKFFVTDKGCRGYKNYIKELTEIINLDPENVVCVPDIETQILNVETGMGISALGQTPRIMMNEELKFYPIDGLHMKFVAVWNKENNNPTKEILRKIIKRKIREGGYANLIG